MNIPRLSIIVPAYNEEKYIALTLKAIAAQEYKNIEVIVVDNNSKDRTVEKAKEFKVRVVTEKKQGITHARQCGFAHATGEIVAKVDADTRLPKHWATRIMQEFDRRPNIVGVSGLPEFTEEGKFLRIVSKISFILTIYSIRLLFGHFQLVGSNCAVRKSAIQNITPHFDDSMVHEDIDLACHIEKRGKIVFLSSLTVSTSARRFKKSPLEFFRYVILTFRTFKLHHL